MPIRTKYPATCGRLRTISAVIRRANQVLVVLVAAGLVALVNDLHARWIVLSAVLLAVVAAGRFGDASHRVRRLTGELGLLLVPVFALLGIDVVIAQFTDRALPPLAGLLLGAVLVFGIAYVYAKPLGEDHTIGYPYVHAIAAVLVLIVIPTALVGVSGVLRGDGEKLDRRETVSRLDVILLCACDTEVDPGPTRLKGWSVRTWTGRVSPADAISWDGGEVPPPVQRDDTDRVVLLRPGRNANPLRWAGLAARAEVPSAATYALLDDATPEEQDDWRTVTRTSGGGVVDVTALGGRPVAELGLRAAALSPTADTDLALADDHRPVLLFDGHEPVPRPLDVDGLLASGLIRMCSSAQKVSCAAVDGGDGLRTGYDHLSFSTKQVAQADVATTMYVNVTRSGNDARNAIYLDYWWYLPDNPARAGGGAFCGPGFTIGGTTCFDHQSDWEGVTVVLDGDDPDGAPLAVNYAQHTGSIHYSWAALTRLWGGAERPAGRPLVYVARGTHAAYPRACRAAHCPHNPVPGIRDDSSVEDTPHDGRRPWSGNRCTATCLTALPTRQEGSEPASWAAWDGVWGTANCVLGVVCSSTQPPASPGRQRRFAKPWCVALSFDFDGTRFARSKGSCPGRRPAADELTRGRSLLALGDSYSSGEGAGAYEGDSARPGNTCHRSPRAWPVLLARRERMTALPSLACSGAVVQELLTGRPHAQQERTLGQVPRVSGRPALITVTIGGNDVGFADVLKDCIAGDCIARYRRADDVLDTRIAALGRRLPDVYRAIEAAAPDARVLVSDYPRLFPAERVPNCAAGGRISIDEAQYLNEKQALLDQTIIAAAHEAGVESVDVSEAFAGHELRCGSGGYLNPLRLGSALRSGSFHPNARGHERLALVISRALG